MTTEEEEGHRRFVEQSNEELSDREAIEGMGCILTLSFIPLVFVWFLLSLIGAKSKFWVLGIGLIPVLLWRLYPYWLLARAKRPLAIGKGLFVNGRTKRDLLKIASIVTVAYLLAIVLFDEIPRPHW